LGSLCVWLNVLGPKLITFGLAIAPLMIFVNMWSSVQCLMTVTLSPHTIELPLSKYVLWFNRKHETFQCWLLISYSLSCWLLTIKKEIGIRIWCIFVVLTWSECHLDFIFMTDWNWSLFSYWRISRWKGHGTCFGRCTI